MQYIKFSPKQSEVNKSHSQEQQKLSSLGVECFWGFCGTWSQSLPLEVLKPCLSEEAFFAHCFPSFFVIPNGMLQFLTVRDLSGVPGSFSTPWNWGWEGVLSVHAGEPQCLMAWRKKHLLSHSPRAGLHFQLSFLTASEAEQAENCPGEVGRFSVESSTLPPLTSFVFFYHFMSLLLAFYLLKHLGIAFLCVNNLV